MKKRNRLLAMLMAAAMVLALMPAAAFAGESSRSADLGQTIAVGQTVTVNFTPGEDEYLYYTPEKTGAVQLEGASDDMSSSLFV